MLVFKLATLPGKSESSSSLRPSTNEQCRAQLWLLVARSLQARRNSNAIHDHHPRLQGYSCTSGCEDPTIAPSLPISTNLNHTSNLIFNISLIMIAPWHGFSTPRPPGHFSKVQDRSGRHCRGVGGRIQGGRGKAQL